MTKGTLMAAIVPLPLFGLTIAASLLASEPEPRLIGFGCGPERATLLAVEEDHFPLCEAIEPVALACRINLTREEGGAWKEMRFLTLKPEECATYWGDGY